VTGQSNAMSDTEHGYLHRHKSIHTACEPYYF